MKKLPEMWLYEKLIFEEKIVIFFQYIMLGGRNYQIMVEYKGRWGLVGMGGITAVLR